VIALLLALHPAAQRPLSRQDGDAGHAFLFSMLTDFGRQVLNFGRRVKRQPSA
jgi:hypothetical protein